MGSPEPCRYRRLLVLDLPLALCCRTVDTDPQEALARGGLNWYAFMAFYVPASILVGIGMAKLVEYPFLRLRDKWYPSRSKAVAVEAPAESARDPVGAVPAP